MGYSKENYEKNKEAIRGYARKSYEKNKEAIKEKQRKYYIEHKEEILAKAKEKRASEKTNGVVKPKKKYVYEKPLTPKQAEKKFIKSLKEKYKGFKFEMNDNVLVVEVKNPFRLIKEAYGVKHCDDEGINKLQFELRRRLHPLSKHNNLVIVDCQYTQLFLSKEDNIDELCEETRKFIKEKLAIYGQYYKNNKKCNKDFE